MSEQKAKDKKVGGGRNFDRVSDLTDKWKRAVADYRNLERRITKEKEAYASVVSIVLLAEFLPILDNLETAQNTLKDSGIGLIIKQFKEILEKQGVHEIDCEGSVFDPRTMEAIEVTKGKKDRVIEVLQKGYLYREKTLRPAKVKVGEGN